MKINPIGHLVKTNPIKPNLSQLKPISMPIKPKQSQFQNPTQSQRGAFFAHQRSRGDLPLGKSKQTVTSRPSACQVWLCNCSNLLTLQSWIGFLLITSFGAFASRATTAGDALLIDIQFICQIAHSLNRPSSVVYN